MYDAEDGNSIGLHLLYPTSTFSVTVPAQSGDLYFTVETYYQKMIPYACQWFQFYVPFASFVIKQNGVQIASDAYWESYAQPQLLLESDYAAGDVFTIEVSYSWYGWTTMDYTVKVYSEQDLEVLDSDGNSNVVYYDG